MSTRRLWKGWLRLHPTFKIRKNMRIVLMQYQIDLADHIDLRELKARIEREAIDNLCDRVRRIDIALWGEPQ